MITVVLLIPFAAAGITYALRNLRFAAATFSAATALGLAALLILGAATPELVILGRSLILLPPVRAHLAFGLVLLALVFLTTWHLPENGLSPMMAFLSLGFMFLAAATQTMSLSVLFAIASAAGMVMTVSSAPARPNLWAVRMLAIIVAAGFLMVAAAWIVEQPVSDTAIVPAHMAPILLFLGYWVLFAAFPFSVWQLPGLKTDSSIARVLLGVVLSQTLLVQALLQLETNLAPINALVPVLLFYAGMATLIMGGIGVVVQHRLSGMLAYLTMGEFGAALIALGSGATFASSLGTLCLLYRGVGLVAMSIGVRVLSHSLGDDDIERMRGVFRRAPMAVAGTLMAGLSLAGFPPMAGFSTRFAIYRMIASERPIWAIALVIAGMLPAVALTRFAVRAFQAVPVPGSRREPLWPAVLVLSLGILLLIAGLWPQGVGTLLAQWGDLLVGMSTAP